MYRGGRLHSPAVCMRCVAGRYSFKNQMKQEILLKKAIIADNAYVSVHCNTPAFVTAEQFTIHAYLHAQHKTLNGQPDFFEFFKKNFLHNIHQCSDFSIPLRVLQLS